MPLISFDNDLREGEEKTRVVDYVARAIRSRSLSKQSGNESTSRTTPRTTLKKMSFHRARDMAQLLLTAIEIPR